MSKKLHATRRNFLKLSAAGTAGLALLNTEKTFAKTTAWPTNGTKLAINPNISNTRVISCLDPTMLTTQTPPGYTFAQQIALVNETKVLSNLDLMAIKLATSTANPNPTAAQAWALIFQKPTAKAWNAVKVAIKINCINMENMPHLAILKKLSTVLTGLGVAATNIFVYDGCAAGDNAGGAQTTKYAAYFSTTDTTKIAGQVSNLNSLMGGTINTTPVPVLGNHTCTANISNGTIDILINCAVNKGHAKYAGGTTLCLKNHFGTFAPDHGGVVADNILGFNKSDAIIGGTPPRQQLCIIDSLVGDINDNPDGTPTKVVNRLIMGTFAPVIDYLTTMNVRKPIMVGTGTDKHDYTVINRFLTDFGYAITDTFQWVEFTPPIVGIQTSNQINQDARSFEVAINGAKHQASRVHFSLPNNNRSIEVTIIDMHGSVVRTLAQHSGSSFAMWDGRINNGSMASAGNYVVHVTSGSFKTTGKIAVY
jgi:hypothetical protein